MAMGRFFAASNGRYIKVSGRRLYIFAEDNTNVLQGFDFLNDNDMQALREFIEGGETLWPDLRQARHGDVWRVVYEGVEYAGSLDADLDLVINSAYKTYLNITDEDITDAELLWRKKEEE